MLSASCDFLWAHHKTSSYLTPKQKAAFKKMDDKHKKVKTMAADRAIDKKLIAKAKKVK